MTAQRVLSSRQRRTGTLFNEVVVWRWPRPLRDGRPLCKNRLVLAPNGPCPLLYDNERSKGDHKHMDHQAHPSPFVTLPRLLTDFDRDIRRWRSAHADADH